MADLKTEVTRKQSTQNFPKKTNISYPLIRTPRYADHGLRNICFSENLAWFFCYFRLEIRPFSLLLTICTMRVMLTIGLNFQKLERNYGA